MSLRTYTYQIQSDPMSRVESGQIEAKNIEDAKRQLRVQYMLAILPEDTLLVDQSEVDENQARQKSAKARDLLRVLADHHAWTKDSNQGARANLNNLNLTDMVMPKSKLQNADMAGADFSGADLSGSNLTNANLVRASLHGANLKDADLTGADLSDADLRGAILTGAILDGVDLWRANLMGCVISPSALHKALSCKTK
ncbi:pentapeptide repeat-containing protein [Kiloniella antarctica]|uniref:Pentapeptide repeat-containing protein n=1 Tax=Kiloniella antarctica TaxID=1550907 RepID=A0ABW5BK91_9PROT